MENWLYDLSDNPDARSTARPAEGLPLYRNELQSVQNATGQLDRLEENVLSLAKMPKRFRVYDREPWRSRNLRVMPVDNYLVFYIPNHQEKLVTVIRIMYGGRDVDAQLHRSSM